MSLILDVLLKDVLDQLINSSFFFFLGQVFSFFFLPTHFLLSSFFLHIMHNVIKIQMGWQEGQNQVFNSTIAKECLFQT